MILSSQFLNLAMYHSNFCCTAALQGQANRSLDQYYGDWIGHYRMPEVGSACFKEIAQQRDSDASLKLYHLVKGRIRLHPKSMSFEICQLYCFNEARATARFGPLLRRALNLENRHDPVCLVGTLSNKSLLEVERTCRG